MNTRIHMPSHGAAASTDVTLAEIEHHYRHGRRLQAEAVGRGLRRAVRFLTGAASRPETTATASDDVAHTMTSSLAAIRSTAEPPRDRPNLDVAERKRRPGRLLEEEQRLERPPPKALQGAA